MKSELDELKDKYIEQFKDGYPAFTLPRMKEMEEIEFIKKCLAENKPANYYYPLIKGVTY